MKAHTFFDSRLILDAVERAREATLRAGGALVRRLARAGLRKRKASASEGQPPSSHEGDLKQLLFFDYDRNTQSEVIGPIKTKDSNIPNALEFGGTATLRYKNGRTATAAYRKFPYMAPALDKAAPQLPSHWRNSIRAA